MKRKSFQRFIKCTYRPNLHDSKFFKKMQINLKRKSISKNPHEHLMRFGLEWCYMWIQYLIIQMFREEVKLLTFLYHWLLQVNGILRPNQWLYMVMMQMRCKCICRWVNANEWIRMQVKIFWGGKNLGYDSCPYLNNFTGWHEWLQIS